MKQIKVIAFDANDPLFQAAEKKFLLLFGKLLTVIQNLDKHLLLAMLLA